VAAVLRTVARARSPFFPFPFFLSVWSTREWLTSSAARELAGPWGVRARRRRALRGGERAGVDEDGAGEVTGHAEGLIKVHHRDLRAVRASGHASSKQRSRCLRKQLVRWFRGSTEHSGARPSNGPPFHGRSFHTEFTGYLRRVPNWSNTRLKLAKHPLEIGQTPAFLMRVGSLARRRGGAGHQRSISRLLTKGMRFTPGTSTTCTGTVGLSGGETEGRGRRRVQRQTGETHEKQHGGCSASVHGGCSASCGVMSVVG
jgi:hypothetical protein